jgi:hypothetical protein
VFFRGPQTCSDTHFDPEIKSTRLIELETEDKRKFTFLKKRLNHKKYSFIVLSNYYVYREKRKNKEYYLCKHLFVLATVFLYPPRWSQFTFQTIHYSISGRHRHLIDRKDSCVNFNVPLLFYLSRSRHK